MSLPLSLRRTAQAEFDEAFDWYEVQQPGLGIRFAARVQETFDRIAANPEMYPIVLGDVRRALVSRFPYAIYFRIRAQRIRMLAVFHSSRDLRIWQARR